MKAAAALGPVCVTTAADAAAHVAEEIAELVRDAARREAYAVIGLATGRTMEGVYAALAELHAREPLPTHAFQGVLIDEYLGLWRGDPRRFRSVIHDSLAALHLPRERVAGFDVDGTPFAVERGARRYAAWIAGLGGIDLLLLGVGRNGHVAFNEPGSSARSEARVVRLAEETRADASGAFGSPQRAPVRAVTLGLADLCAARRVRVLAFGRAKRPALRRLHRSCPTPSLPVSLLRGHADLRLYVDDDALGERSEEQA